MLDQAFQDLKTYDWGIDPKKLSAIDEAIVASHGNSGRRGELEQKLTRTLAEGVPQAATDYICRKLRVIGTADSVPALAKLLDNEQTSHMARYALQSMPAPEAAQALRDAVPRLQDQQKAGVLGSLGARQEAESVDVLASCLADKDEAVSHAAAHALGALNAAEAAQALAKANPTNPETTDAVVASSLEAAENLLKSGDTSGAQTIYTRLASSDQPKHVCIAATRGLIHCKR